MLVESKSEIPIVVVGSYNLMDTSALNVLTVSGTAVVALLLPSSSGAFDLNAGISGE